MLEHRLGDVFQRRLGGDGTARLLGQHVGQRVDIEVTQLDEVRPDATAIDHLRFERCVQHLGGNQPQACQQISEPLAHRFAAYRGPRSADPELEACAQVILLARAQTCAEPLRMSVRAYMLSLLSGGRETAPLTPPEA